MGKFKGVRVNPELPIVLIITFILLLGGVLLLFFGSNSEFNFYSSKIVINENTVQEELHYKPDKPYHTLYRGFDTPIYLDNSLETKFGNYILIGDVGCSSGDSYLRDYLGRCYDQGETISCYPYTENNEYGCTFGESLGFSRKKEYVINSKYEIYPENLFKINDEYYIKFVVYSSNNHVKLTKRNFIVEGDVVIDKRYLPDHNVIIYIPYAVEASNLSVINREGFEFDSDYDSLLDKFVFIFFSFLPGIFFFVIWLIFGKELYHQQIPKELSTFPSKRKAWEVAAYFNTPFMKIDKNFFASVLLKFYNDRVIDVKEIDKEIYIKLNKFVGDEIEKRVYEILEKIKEGLKPNNKAIRGEYFNLKEAMKNNFGLTPYKKFVELQEIIKKEGKEYLEDNFSKIGIVASIFILLLFVIIRFMSGKMILLYVLTFLIMMILPLTGAIFARFNKDYYVEYQKWKSFKRYLKNSFSIRTATHKTVVMWNEYLIYATALGVPEKVIKELKAHNLIDGKQFNVYNGVILSSSFAFSSSSSGGFSGGGMGGGFSGAGGGGIGGGGGGGR
jgi:uncharacterized membrane protein YgcG